MGKREINFYKNKKSDSIWWVDNADEFKGRREFSFDRKTIFNLFADYPYKLTAEQRRIFDKENPYWATYFKNRK